MTYDIIEISPEEDFLIYELVLWMKNHFDMKNPSIPRARRFTFSDLKNELEDTFPAFKKFQENRLEEAACRTRERESEKRERKKQEIKGLKVIKTWQYPRSHEAIRRMIEREKTKTKDKGIVRQLSEYRTTLTS